MTTDVHNLGNFASLAAAWERYPNGAMVGDYIFIAGVRYDWDKYEKQWLTPVAVTDMNISVFDVSTYDFEANDWRHALLNGEYTVVSNTQAVGKLLKYDDGFVLEGFVTLTEAGADKVFSPVVDGGKPKTDAKILSGNQSYHKYVYVDSKGVYNVSDATERGQIDDIQHHLDDLQQILEYDKALVTALTPDSTSEEISLAFVPIGAKDKTTPVLPKVNDLLVTNGSMKEMAQFVNVTDYLTPKGTHRYTLIYQDGSILHTIQMLGFTSVHSVGQNDLADFLEVELVTKAI